MKHYGPAVVEAEEIPISLQRERILDLARQYCITPTEAYWFRLYRDPDKALDYVYGAETAGMHLLINGRRRLEDHDALMDKAAVSDRLKGLGLPVVPTLALLETGSGEQSKELERLALTEARGVFVKARTGSRAQGAFWVFGSGASSALKGRLLTGQPLNNAEDVRAALKTLCRNDTALVQERLGNHPFLASVSSDDAAVVLRVISQRRDETNETVRLLSAHLRLPVELPRPRAETQELEVVLRVDTEFGRITCSPTSELSLRKTTEKIEKSIFDGLGVDAKVPFWRQIHDSSLAAHEAYSQLWAIAWDWIVTPEGPRLLEGNVIWGMRRPQLMDGGMIEVLKNATSSRTTKT